MVSPFSRDQTTLVSGSLFELRLSRLSRFFLTLTTTCPVDAAVSIIVSGNVSGNLRIFACRTNGVKSAAKIASGIPEIRNAATCRA
jgi:hypothetical protein